MIDLTMRKMSEMLASGEVSSVELTKASLKKISQDKINAFNTVCEELSLKKAQEVDSRRAAGEKLSPLAGVPIGIKDNMSTAGIKTTCSSRMLENYIPPYDATAVAKLKAQDAILIGKLNMDEFAMGSSNETSYFGRVLNPVDKQRVPGGSSGGSAASVAAFEVAGSLGSDTGGSIRQPASLCGIVGLKPTYGLVSRYGLIAFASSLDQIGTFTRSVYDNAMLLSAIAEYDAKDSTSVNVGNIDYTKSITGNIKGLRVGVDKDFFTEGLDTETEKSVKSAIAFYESEGAEIIDISIPYMEEMLSVYYIISSAEAASNLARFDGVKYGYRSKEFTDIVDLYVKSRTEGFGDEVKRRIMLGNYVLSSGYYDAYYLKALKVRTLVTEGFNEAFKKCDIIASPTSPCTAFKFGEKSANPLQMYLSDYYTVSANIVGCPAISIPCGKDKNELPIGLHLIGKSFDEASIFNAADYFENHGGAKWITK